MLRIVAGKYRGASLDLPPGSITRPSSNRLRQAVFNILAFKTEWGSVIVCDAFAGSGAMGLEAVSRGARSVVFCENSPHSLVVLRKNIARVLKDDLASVDTRGDFFALRGLKFDLIFADPPYGANIGAKTLRHVRDEKLLNPGGIAILEEKTGSVTEVSGFDMFDGRAYGNCQIGFYALKPR